MTQERYRYFIKYDCQNNLYGSIHTTEKLIKAAENIWFEDERHIDLRMGLMRKDDKAGALVKEKYILVNQWEKKYQDFE